MPSPLGCSFDGRMRFRRKDLPSAEAPSVEEEKTNKTAEASAFAASAFGGEFAESLRRVCRGVAQQESVAAEFAESHREFNGQVDSAADCTTARAASRIAGISR
ncbi:hypothetical protein AXG93_2145s1910 [Marchantia polymorpha subsp. ruderalis]|uniref:Uncharacterized protein n=1 Tax=Marchantia polymorpha subsp. ruderalis TaxID=1480154 RepID=A0A176W039_MARPO|nr:hypothetical protein AXG93_2145s1910 [Marchantia polymorpha subsp. ruderalis]